MTLPSDSSKKRVVFHPIINGLQKIALYETWKKYYLIGSNATQTKFRVLKIDRTEPEKLIITDDKVLYSHSEIKRLLQDHSRADAAPGSKLARTTSAFGVVGFVRFLLGYYMILVTKRRKVASVGLHSIYKIEDTSIKYIPHESCRVHKGVHEEEQKYLRLFLNVDLKANFYFSYSYDLTRTLQYNLAPPSGNVTLVSAEEVERFLPDGRHQLPRSTAEEDHFVYCPSHDARYSWNSYLLDAAPDLHPAWKLCITHGFIEQVNINVFGHSYYVTLIARRSRMYAGTRFLKRGTNFEGDVANEVETEQIVFDSDRADLPDGRFSSFVQVRGSIPLMWSQDVSTRAPRPPISIYLNDPYAIAAGRHFNRLLKRHGSPVLILDLTKRSETRNFESSLGPHFRQLVNQLNISALPYFALDYRSLDMAHLNKRPKDNAMKYLFLFSTWALKRTGVFFTPSTPRTGGPATPVHQTGTVRVNCVDCLDRTNTAQFALAKCALAHQLYVMGVLMEPHIPWDSDCSRVLEDLYEDHGDTMALQYGGSQLVHRIQTYRHTAKWSSHGSDMMQSLSRYYSNRFSDLEKQQSFNVFLGFYVPHRESTPLWEMSSDYALHNARAKGLPLQIPKDEQWWDRALLSSLPLPLDLLTKRSLFVAPLTPSNHAAVDLYCDFYRPSEMTVMADHFQQNITSTLNYMGRASNAATSVNPSPFCPRLSASKLQQHQQKEEEERRLSVSSMSGSGGRNSSEERSKLKRSSSNSCNSSSDESSSANDDPGIWPPLDTPLSWLYEAQAFENLKAGPCHKSGYTCSQAFLSQITRPFPVPALKVMFTRPLCYFGGNKSEERKKADDLRDSRDREIALLLKEVDNRQKNVYAEEQSFHLKRQFDPTHERCDEEPVDRFMVSKNLVKRMFPSCEVTYGRIYKELTKGELTLFRRYARMAERCGPCIDFLVGSCELSFGAGGGEGCAGGCSSGDASGGCNSSGEACEEGNYSAVASEEDVGSLHWFAQLKDSSSRFWRDPESSLPKFAEPLRLVQESTFTQDSYVEVDEPTVGRESRDLYQLSVDVTEFGPREPSKQDLQLYLDSAALSS